MTWRPALWLVAFAVILVDFVSKQWALAQLTPGETRELLGEWLRLQLVFNDGAALSIGSGHTWLLTLISMAVTVAIIVYARRAKSTLAVVLFGIGLGGALGNLVDRLFREPSFGQGHVVDMIAYGNLFVGNVADIAIVGAAVAFAVLATLGVRILEPKPAAGATSASGDLAATDAEAASGTQLAPASGNSSDAEPAASPTDPAQDP